MLYLCGIISLKKVFSLKLYYDKRLSDPTYYAQLGVRNGKKTTTRNVKNFGKHSQLLLITDDPLAYVQEEIRKMNEDYRVGKVDMNVTLNFNEKIPNKNNDAYSKSDLLNVGYFYLQSLYQNLHLSQFFHTITLNSKITFDCDTIHRFLTFARILDPTSKYGTFDKLSTYYEQPDFSYQHILRFMDILDTHSQEYIEHLYHFSNPIVKRDTSVLYYDCTNYYFECETYDDDLMDEVTGELIKGLRQFGVSKEHRPNPIVEMGLIIDNRGIPVSMCLHPGNTSEQLTAIPLEKEVLHMLEGKEFIYCADGGLGSYNIRKFNSMGGRAFIVTQSIKKLSDTLKEAVFNDFDYRLLSNNTPVTIEHMMTFDRHDEKNIDLYNDRAYKIVEADKIVDLGLVEEKVYKNGNVRKVKSKATLKQYLIITFSRKMMEYQRTIRNRQIERAKKLLQLKDPEEIKKGPNDVHRFLKRIAKGKGGEEAKVQYALDLEKIAEEEKYDGYYAVATNLQDDAKTILNIAQQRYKIEDCFRVMKTHFNGRPIYHRKPERIRAHFLICYTALLIYRLLECRLEDQNTHVTTDQLIKTLNNMNVVNVHDLYYIAVYQGSNTLTALEKDMPLLLDRKYYQPKDLTKIIKKLLKA